MNPRLPTSSADMDAPWFEAALSARYHGIVVKEARLTRAIHGTSTKLFYTLDYGPASPNAAPKHVVVKTGLEPHSASMSAMYRAETLFYRDAAPRIPIHVPACHYAALDPIGPHSLAVIDDLTVRGAHFCAAQEPFTFDRASAFLDALARYHAFCWESPLIEPDGPLGSLNDPLTGYSHTYHEAWLAPDFWRSSIAKPRGAAVPRILHDRDRMGGALDALAQLHQDQPKTFSHGDTHPGNLFVEPDGTPGFFDCVPCRSPWFKDVAYHLTAALDILDRRAWIDRLLAYYLDRLTFHGGPAISFDEARHLVACEIVFGLFIFLVNGDEFQAEAVNTAYATRFATAALDDDSFGRLLLVNS